MLFRSGKPLGFGCIRLATKLRHLDRVQQVSHAQAFFIVDGDRHKLVTGRNGNRKLDGPDLVGINSRLDTIQAAVLRVKLRHLSDWSRKRQENASRYQQSLQGIPGLELPVATPHGEHVWNQYTVRVLNGRRDWLRDQLTRCGIGTEIYYPVPLHQQICFRSLGYQTGSLPETERTATEEIGRAHV